MVLQISALGTGVPPMLMTAQYSRQQVGSRAWHSDWIRAHSSLRQSALMSPQPVTDPPGMALPSHILLLAQSTKSLNQPPSHMGGPHVEPFSPMQSMQTWAHTLPGWQEPAAMA